MNVSMEDIGAMEFGRGLGKLIPDDQNLSQQWLREYYKKVPGTYPAMSTGSSSVAQAGPSEAAQSGSLAAARAQVKPSSYSWGATAGPKGRMTNPSVSSYSYIEPRSGRVVSAVGSGFGAGSGPARSGQEYADWKASLEAKSSERIRQQAERTAARSAWSAAQPIYEARRSAGAGAGAAKPAPQQWLGPEPAQPRDVNQQISDRLAMTPEKSRSVFAAMMGLGEGESPVMATTPMPIRVLSSPWLWVGVAVLAGVYLVNRKRD